MSSRNLLVMCVGNICRSPMAQVLLAQALPNWTVSSAGLSGLVNAPADPFTLEVLGDLAGALDNHKGRVVSDALVREAELVLVMSIAQREETERRYPWAKGRVFRIGHWDDFDIPDPYQRPLSAFEQTRLLLDAAVLSWQKRLN